MSDTIKIKLGQRIKTLRNRHSLTQEELASLADIDYKYLQRIEGKNPPDMGVILIQKIAKALKTTPSNLLK
jgi:transcriptional regulator with XRE-family HTH domain